MIVINHTESLLRQPPGAAAGVYLVDELHVAGETLQGLHYYHHYYSLSSLFSAIILGAF